MINHQLDASRMIDNLKLQLKNHHHHHNNSTSFENGGCSASTFSEDDHFTETSVFSEPRHTEAIDGLKELPNQNWRTKERMKTMSVAIVLCLNVGVDPPDVVKPNPSAILQCWSDPFSTQPTKAAETIATKLIKQYERWQPRARYKHCIDPTVEDIKKLCTTLRRTSKEERVLFHYNGHGVPKPTVNGEIWVFNRSFTQYIPLSLFDLQQWMGSPSIYVFDCSNAGIIVELFATFAIQHEKEYEMNATTSSYMAAPKPPDDLLGGGGAQGPKAPPRPNYQSCILLAACDKGESLPLHPDLPADLFTSCLTTPIKTFLVWFIKRNARKLAPNINVDLIDKIPGSLTDRKSILGELNWIFTAITDTIAWNTLPRDLFQRLFRQDLLVASLFRNFLLAQRIMRSYDCTPVSNPPIQSVHHHPMWKSWDLAVDSCLTQLAAMDLASKSFTPPPYVPSQFFTEQLTAFQVWLKLSSFPSSTPEQLPIVLQVLLSQVHRSRALDLLGNFLNLGPWAVNLALSVGIFPYVLKLLQASAKELRPFLVFIWAKILAIDESYQSELIRENAHVYFMKILADSYISTSHQIMAAFVLSVIVRHNPHGQNTVVQGGSSSLPNGSIIDIALSLLLEQQQEDHPNLRKWLLICLGNVWENNAEVKGLATRNAVADKLFALLEDPVPEVRAAAVYALGTFINSISARNEHANQVDFAVASTLVQKLFYDSSPLVRKELLVTLHWFILIFENVFISDLRRSYENFCSKFSKGSFAGGGGGGGGGNGQQPQGSREHSPQNSYADRHREASVPMVATNHIESITYAVPQQTLNNYHADSPASSSANNNNNNNNNLPVRKVSRSSFKFFSGSMSITVPNALSIAHLNYSQQHPKLTPPMMMSSTSAMKRVNSANSLLNFSIITGSAGVKAVSSVPNRVWQMVELYVLDPEPEVARMASLIYGDLLAKANIPRDGSSLSCNSEPDSPSNSQQNSYASHDSSSLQQQLNNSSSNSGVVVVDAAVAATATTFLEKVTSTSRSSTPVRDAAAANKQQQQQQHPSGRVSVSGAACSPYLPSASSYSSFTNTPFVPRRLIFGREAPSERPAAAEAKDRNGGTAAAAAAAVRANGSAGSGRHSAVDNPLKTATAAAAAADSTETAHSTTRPHRYLDPRHQNGSGPSQWGGKTMDGPQNASQAEEELQACRKPLVSTGFIDWCTKHFCQPCSHLGICGCASSVEITSQGDMVAEWRSSMLRRYYRKIRADLEGQHHSRSTGGSSSASPEVIVQRRGAEASLLALHPFEKSLVSASGSSYSVWNYGQQRGQYSNELPQLLTATTYSNDTNAYVIENGGGGGGGGGARITDLKLINTHDRALVMVAAEDSSVKVWADLLPTTFSSLCPEEGEETVAGNSVKNGGGGRGGRGGTLTPRLATAFFIFEDGPLGSGAGAPSSSSSSGGVYQRSARLRLWWEQCQQRLVAGGEHRFVRLWDANRETKIRDIVTGMADYAAVTSLASDYHHLICVGGEDGSVRLFDDRQKSNAAQIYSDRNSPIVNAMIWPGGGGGGLGSADNAIHLVSGNRSGDICWYDRRSPKAVRIESNAAPMTAMDFHENTDVFACAFGTDSSEMQIYTLDTLKGPLLRNRNRHVKCLSFHGLKSKFALALSDGTLAIYKTALRLPPPQNNSF